MSKRLYLAPLVIDTFMGHTRRRPKYIIDNSSDWSGMDYGLESVMLVAAEVTALQHTTIAANTDVIAFSEDLDETVSLVNLTLLRSGVEGLRIPAGWVDQTIPYRRLARFAAGLFLLFQRLHANVNVTVFETGVTLDTRINQLSAARRQALQDAAQQLNLDISGITGPMTLRAALKLLADQFGPIGIGGITL